MKNKKILIIDDDNVDRKIIRKALEKAQWQGQIIDVNSAEDGRKVLEEQSIDCILLDYNLPTVNGLAFLTELYNSFSSQIPIIMLTGEGNEMLAVNAMKEGACDYLPKSFISAETLFQIIKNAIEKSELATELIKIRAELERQALYDGLTGLGNRRLFMRDLEHKIASFQRYKIPFCLLMMDLNKFKQANDTYGHDAGDAILEEVGKRLVLVGRNSDCFYRLGGDEFTAIIESVTSLDIIAFAQRIRETVSLPILWQNQTLEIGMSIGITESLENLNSNELLKIADSAMYEAKRSGKGIVI